MHCDVRASFATAFRNWRLKSKTPLKKIAMDLGVSIATVNNWELGKQFPNGRHFEMLANYTGVPPCRLFCVMADMCPRGLPARDAQKEAVTNPQHSLPFLV